MKDVTPVGEVPDRPYSLRDPNDSFSLIHFLSEKLKGIVTDLPEDLLDMSEAELKAKAHPTPGDYALRVSFWREFERVMWKGHGKIASASIYAGIVSDSYFYNKFLTNKYKFAWMIRPSQTYQKEMDAILYRCTERLWELIEIPLQNKRGQLDSKAAEVLLKTIAQVENRVKGMAVQRSEKKNLNVNVVTRTKAVQGSESMDSLDARIKELEIEVGGEQITDRGEGRVSDHQVLSLEAKKEEREVVHVGLLRSANPVGS